MNNYYALVTEPTPPAILVSDELADLQGRINRLNKFICKSDMYNRLEKEEQELLRKQHAAMVLYASCLMAQLKYWQTQKEQV